MCTAWDFIWSFMLEQHPGERKGCKWYLNQRLSASSMYIRLAWGAFKRHQGLDPNIYQLNLEPKNFILFNVPQVKVENHWFTCTECIHNIVQSTQGRKTAQGFYKLIVKRKSRKHQIKAAEFRPGLKRASLPCSHQIKSQINCQLTTFLNSLDSWGHRGTHQPKI